jgi:anthranilate synthase component 2
MILVVDHYDSFIYNLVQLVEERGRDALVVRSDTYDAGSLTAREPDAVILSPGPGRPEEAGCMLDLIRTLDAGTPTLGVCLGHQAIGMAYGARIVCAPAPVHGKVSSISHRAMGLLAGVPDPFDAGRYHSLAIDRASLPPELEVTAETDDGVVMAMQHRRLPRFGVQFHPESILTPWGRKIVDNFLALVPN